MDGGSLKDIIESGDLYEGGDEAALERMLDISIQFARGLHYAHEQQLIHQDVKPDNLLLSKTGEAKVSDFGAAGARMAIGAQGTNTRAGNGGTIVSETGAYTLAYCSPEQAPKVSPERVPEATFSSSAIKETRLTRRTDIWSWAVSVLEMFRGERLWNYGVAAGTACEEYFDMARIPLPEAMKELLRRCFKENEAERPHDFKEIETKLLEIYRAETGAAYSRTEPKAAADTADSLNNKALSYLDMGKPEEAEACWERALTIDPSHTESLYNRSVYLWQSTKIDDIEAIRLLESAGKNPEYHLAKLHLIRGDAETAIEYLNKAVKISGETNEIKNVRFLAGKMIEENRDGRIIRNVTDSVLSDLHAFNSDSNRIASAFYSQKGLEIWNIITGEIIGTVPNPEKITAIDVSPDGIHVLCFFSNYEGDHKGTIELWNVLEGKCIYSVKAEQTFSVIKCICFNPDGKLAFLGGVKKGTNLFEAAMGGAEESMLWLWDVTAGTCIRRFDVCSEAILSGCFSPDSSKILSGSNKGTIKIWDVTTGKCIRVFKQKSLCVSAVAFNPDGRRILGISSGGSFEDRIDMNLWNINTGTRIQTFYDFKGYVYSSHFSPDGSMAVTSSGREGCVKLWDMTTGKCICSYEMMLRLRVDQKTSAYFISGNKELIFGGKDGIKIWRIPQVSENVEMALSRIHTTGEATKQAALFNSLVNDVDRLVSGGDILTALIRLEELRNIRTFGNNAAYYAATRKLLPYCIRGKVREQNLRIHLEKCKTFCFSPKGDKILIAQDQKLANKTFKQDNTLLMLWDINAGQCIRTLDIHTETILNRAWEYACTFDVICFNSDGNQALISCEDNLVHLWDLTTGKFIHTFEHLGVMAVSFSPDGSKIFSKDGHGGMKVWDTVTKECLHTFAGKGNITRSPDGLTIFADISKELIDVSTGQCIGTLEGETGCFSPDSSQVLVVCKKEKNMKLWDINARKYIQTFYLSDTENAPVCFSPDGSLILRGNTQKLSLWHTCTGEHTYIKEDSIIDNYGYNFEKVYFSPDGNKILSLETSRSFINYQLKLWNITTGERLLTFDLGDIPPYEIKLSFSPDGKMIAFTSGKEFYLYEFDYELHFPGWKDWDEGARPYLEIFLKLHPHRTEDDFNNILIPDLQNRGYGWLRPEGVKAKLEEISHNKKLSFWKRLTGGGK
jgi:WD40 repeat protein